MMYVREHNYCTHDTHPRDAQIRKALFTLPCRRDEYYVLDTGDHAHDLCVLVKYARDVRVEKTKYLSVQDFLEACLPCEDWISDLSVEVWA